MEDERIELVAPLNEKLSSINGAYRAVRDPLTKLYDLLRSRVTAYVSAEEVKRAAEAARLQREAAEKERIAREAEANEAAARKPDEDHWARQTAANNLVLLAMRQAGREWFTDQDTRIAESVCASVTKFVAGEIPRRIPYHVSMNSAQPNKALESAERFLFEKHSEDDHA